MAWFKSRFDGIILVRILYISPCLPEDELIFTVSTGEVNAFAPLPIVMILPSLRYVLLLYCHAPHAKNFVITIVLFEYSAQHREVRLSRTSTSSQSEL